MVISSLCHHPTVVQRIADLQTANLQGKPNPAQSVEYNTAVQKFAINIPQEEKQKKRGPKTKEVLWGRRSTSLFWRMVNDSLVEHCILHIVTVFGFPTLLSGRLPRLINVKTLLLGKVNEAMTMATCAVRTASQTWRSDQGFAPEVLQRSDEVPVVDTLAWLFYLYELRSVISKMIINLV
eukprot:5807873-Amphidinium_carterae.1